MISRQRPTTSQGKGPPIIVLAAQHHVGYSLGATDTEMISPIGHSISLPQPSRPDIQHGTSNSSEQAMSLSKDSFQDKECLNCLDATATIAFRCEHLVYCVACLTKWSKDDICKKRSNTHTRKLKADWIYRGQKCPICRAVSKPRKVNDTDVCY